MIFHATAAVAPARPNFTFTFRNHLLCSVCTAMLLAGFGGMAWAEDPEAASGAQPMASTPSQAVPEAVSTVPKEVDALSPQPSVPAKPVTEIAAPAPVASEPAPTAMPVASTPDPIAPAAEVNKPTPNQLDTKPGPAAGEAPAPTEKSDTPKAARITVKSGETRAATPGDKDESFTVENGGTLNAWAGGLVKDVLVQGDKAWDSVTGLGGVGGIAFISGATSHLESGTVDLGGKLSVGNQAAGDMVTVRNGGKLDVYNGGLLKDVTVEGVKAWDSTAALGGIGGIAYILGEGSKLESGTVNLGGYLQVEGKAAAGTVTVRNGGRLDVLNGGTVKDLTVEGIKAWRISDTMDAAGVFPVVDGIGGVAFISGEGSKLESGMVHLGGYLTVKDKAAADTVTVRNGGQLDVVDGGLVKDLTVEGVKAWDSATGLGGIGGLALLFGEKSHLESGTVDLGGGLAVGNRATAGIVTVRNGGDLDVLYGGLVKDLTVEGDKAWDSVTGLGGVGGIAFISGEGSRIDHGTVDLGGYLQVKDKATAGTVTVRNGGKLDVSAGGFVKDLAIKGIEAWDSVTGLGGVGGVAFIVGEGSRVESGMVNRGGFLQVANKAAAGTVTVRNGGRLDVLAEGSADNVNVNGGHARTYGQIGTATVDNAGAVLVFAGGAITGKSTVGNGGILSVVAGGKAGDIELNGGDSNSPPSYAVVNGTAGDITIGRNAVLNGSGTLRNVRVQMSGNVFPGTAVDKLATLNTTGNVTFDNGSFFDVQIANDGVRSGKLATQGQTTLNGGTVKLLAEDLAGTNSQGVAITQFLSQQQVKNLFQKSFVILTADKGVTGRFEKVEPQTNYNYITPSLSYTDKTVSVDFGLEGAVKTQSAEEQVKNLVLVDAVTPNQKSTGHAVMQLGLGNRLLQTVLFSQKGEVLHYDTLSGEAHASLRGTLLQDAGLVSGAASERVRAAFDGVGAKAAPDTTPLAYGPEAKDKRNAGEAFDAATPVPVAATTALWGQAYGGWSHGASDGNAAAYSRSTGGIVTGVDALIAGTWRLGVLAGYGSTSLHGAGSSASADSYQLGIYGGTRIDALTLSLGTVLAHHEIDTRRTVSFGDIAETDAAGYSANTVQLFGEAAYRIETPYAALEPFAAAAYTRLKTSGFAETGGIAALSAPSSSTELTTTTLGLRASRAFTLGDATTLTARGMAGWRHAYGDVTPQAQFAFASGGDSFDVSGLPVAADTALVEAGLAFDIGRATTLGLTYTGQFSSGVNDNAVKADLTVRF